MVTVTVGLAPPIKINRSKMVQKCPPSCSWLPTQSPDSAAHLREAREIQKLPQPKRSQSPLAVARLWMFMGHWCNRIFWILFNCSQKKSVSVQASSSTMFDYWISRSFVETRKLQLEHSTVSQPPANWASTSASPSLAAGHATLTLMWQGVCLATFSSATQIMGRVWENYGTIIKLGFTLHFSQGWNKNPGWTTDTPPRPSWRYLKTWEPANSYKCEMSPWTTPLNCSCFMLFLEFETPFKIQRRVQLLMECYKYFSKTLLRKLQRREPLSIPTLASIAPRPAGDDLMTMECQPEKWLKIAKAKQKQNHRINVGAGAGFAVPLAVCKGSLLTVSHYASGNQSGRFATGLHLLFAVKEIDWAST